MLGLRERQKAKRNGSILEAASTLFGQIGYEAARIDAIAEMAEVSVGTFYNYFETKADLLLAIVSMEVEEVLRRGAVVVDNPPSDPIAAMQTLIATYYDHSLVWLTKEMWRTAMAMSIQHPETPFSRRYRELDQALCTQVKALLLGLRDRGAIQPDVDVNALGEMLFNDLNTAFTVFAMDKRQEMESLRNAVFARAAAVLGLVKVIAQIKPSST
ncbi:MAG: TetR family transcriptional regulator [Cereibacter sphaeroides]|uniref:TetR family transcriptional regulator n=1 Tax=Cereibacter sphaeroides TaxID=1063 RepID=A0A2W5TMI9_CERSP|nr:MAG: TetR family transcriptional regulator [Cereibacter sphaeroides]